ncbi:MAG TPA: hypothetical protein PKH24_07855 [Sedimentisphaerales bacterium]|jgi:hypothetical protein|nr:hypothetical protein [Sedimentisphaerales bacterium]HNU29322.1 hypothetical protein [Sedimentisphaerales bacterium]
MYELLVRIETLLMPLSTVILLGVGVTLLLVGLVFWLGGSRYSTVIVGLLGALVGAVAGLLVSQWLGLHLWLCMIVGAAVLATASVMLRNVLILVLAVLVIAAVSGAGYLAVLLDRVAPADVAQPPSAGIGGITPEGGGATRTEPGFLIQSFTNMDPNTRLNYVDGLIKAKQATEEKNFRDRVRAVLDDTWVTVRPHAWKVGLAVLAGGLVAIFLVWLVKKALIALAYSVVGAATVFLGVQTALLGANVKAISLIGPRPWVLPGTFVGMTALGWLWQLVMSRPKRARHEHEHRHEHEEHAN